MKKKQPVNTNATRHQNPGNAPPPRSEGNPTFTVAELAERWRVAERTVLEAIREGRLAAFKVGKRALRINVGEVERYERTLGAA